MTHQRRLYEGARHFAVPPPVVPEYNPPSSMRSQMLDHGVTDGLTLTVTPHYFPPTTFEYGNYPNNGLQIMQLEQLAQARVLRSAKMMQRAVRPGST